MREVNMEISRRMKQYGWQLMIAGAWGFFISLLFAEFMLRPHFLIDIFFLLREFFIFIVRIILPEDLAWSLDRPIFLLTTFAVGGFAAGSVAEVFGILVAGIRRKERTIKLQGLAGAAFVAFLWVLVITFLKIWTYDLKRPLILATVLFLEVIIGITAFKGLNRFLPKFSKKTGKRFLSVGVIISIIIFTKTMFPYQSTSVCSFADVQKQEERKIAIIGIDGASWNLLEPLIAKGKLPNLSALIERGSNGFLRSFKPMRSPVIWTTIATGKHPGHHGIDNFIVMRPGSTRSTPVTSNLIEEPTLWDIFSSFSRSVSINGWYVSWPAARVEGTLVSDLAVHPGIESRRTYPELLAGLVDSVRVEFENNRENILTDWFGFHPTAGEYTNPVLSSAIAVLDQSFQKDFVTLETAIELLERNGQPSLFVSYFVGSDRVQHKFFKYLWLSEHPTESKILFDADPQEVQRFGNIINSYLMFIDWGLGRILNSLELENTDLFIVSDHGFGPITDEAADVYTYDANSLFCSLGLLRYGESSGEIDLSGTVIFEAGNLPWIKKRSVYFPNTEKDWNHEALRQIAGLLDGLHTENGKQLFDSVKFLPSSGNKDEPVLEIVFSGGIFGQVLSFEGKKIDTSSFIKFKGISGDHRMNGVVTISGPDIQQGKFLTDISVLDIAPTACYLAGLPVLDDMNGKITLEAIRTEFRKKHPLYEMPHSELPWFGLKSHSSDEETVRREMGLEISGNVEEQLLEEMRTLGYIQ